MSRFGPTVALSEELHKMKYRGANESFEECATRIAAHLKDGDEHFRQARDILLNMRFLPAGRVQSAAGSPRKVTPYNCFVMNTIEDSMQGIMDTAHEAALTMRMGGGVGYDFSTLRPRGDRITTLDSQSSGPISFMNIYDAVCSTIACAGHRRGAQMGVLRVDHPDIEEFIRAKQNGDKLTQFNISIGATDVFMEAVRAGTDFPLTFNGKVYKYLNAPALWEEIMRSTWDWAEPGVLFIDSINKMNNLYYCETIAATNPCGEQPLPPYGACLLGSFNLPKYIIDAPSGPFFSYELLKRDIPIIVRMMDNIPDRAIYPLPQQQEEALNKRRMGLGVTGLANAAEILGMPYASNAFIAFEHEVLALVRDISYSASADLSEEKGAFPLFDHGKYMEGAFVQTLPDWVKDKIAEQGIRNSHLTSIAPTGTISLTADNVSSGIEPVFMHEYSRTIREFDKVRTEVVQDYAYSKYNVKGRTSADLSAEDHLKVLIAASKYMDSAVSKTCNVNPNMDWADFKNLYMAAWENGCKGCTTFNPEGKRYGVLNVIKSEEDQGSACYYDPDTGSRSCEG